MSSIGYREDIDALRGVSILLVLIFHAFPETLPGGFVGVDVFFVISGYLITGIILNKVDQDSFSFSSFYHRRITRILPSSLVVLFTALFIGWFILFPDEYEQLGLHVFSSIFFFQNFNLINELGYFDVSSYYKPLVHFWSLSIEEQYYFFWPAIIIFAAKYRFSVIKVISGIVIISFVVNIYFASEYKSTVYLHSVCRFWELGIGSLLAVFYRDGIFKQKYNAGTSYILFLSGIISILVAAFGLSESNLFPYWYGLLPTLGAACMIMANVQLRSWGGLLQLGLISYPLYLWHWVVISFVYIYLGSRPSSSVMFGVILISILLSYLTYKYIEVLRHSKSLKVVYALLSTLVIIGVSGKVIDNSGGFEGRPTIKYASVYEKQLKRTPSVDKQCEQYVTSYLDTDRIFDYCRYSRDTNKEALVAIIGDSHAHAIYPGFKNELKKKGYSTLLMANSSCPPLVDFIWGNSPGEQETCQDKVGQILSVLKKNDRIEKVVFLTRGPVYIHGEVEGEATVVNVKESLGHFVDQDRLNYQTYSNGFDKTLAEIDKLEHIKSVYYVFENPELDFLPKEVIVRPFDFWRISEKRSHADQSLFEMRMKQYRESIQGVSEQYPKVSLIDTAKYLCLDNKCEIFVNNHYLYSDKNHLSVFGSHFVAEKVIDELFEN